MSMTHERGNILWMVLVSIALLGALTAMFARTSSTTDDTGEYENNTIAASKIIRYGKSLELAVQNLLSRGCAENDISFDYDIGNGTGYQNDNSPSNRACHIFYPEGAGLTYETGWGFTGDSRVLDIEDNDRTELIAYFQTARQACMQINTLAGIANDANDAPAENFEDADFTGGFGSTVTDAHTIGNTSAQLAGQRQSCSKNGGGAHLFTIVLIGR